MTIFVGGPQDDIKYTLVAPDGSRCVFNDQTDADYVGMARFTGLDGVDIREAIDPRAGADGGVQGLNFRGPRAITATVDIVPTSTVDRNNKVTKMKRAINARIADGTMSFQPDGGIASQLKYRLSQPHRRGADKVGFVTQYQFALTAADPNIYSQSLHTSTVNASPWQATVTNQGDGQAPPTFTVTVGVAGTVTLTNVTTGQSVVLTSVDPASSFGAWAQTIGSFGNTNGKFSGPRAAVVDGSGNVFVTDSANSRVQKFDSSGNYVSQFGSAGSGNGQFSSPNGITLDGAGKIWVADTGNNRIQRFSAAGVYETQFGTAGSGNGQFNGPSGIAVDGAGNIFVTDTSNHRVQKLTAGTPPTYASQVGTNGTGNGQFSFPVGIVVDSGGTNFWVTDNGNNRVQKFTNASPPVYTSQFGSAGTGDGQFATPYGITRDSANTLYVTDRNNSRVQKFSTAGAFQAKLGSFGSADGLFNAPSGIAMLGSTTSPLYVVDLNNSRFQKFTAGTKVLNFDFSIASVLSAGQNAYNLVDVPSSIWWALQPGDNLIQITGGTSWTINWRDAWE